MASFSRLQLAAALLEYDNDPDDPRAPQRSAYDSAIFARLRNANGNIHATKEAGRSTDYLGIALPSDTGAPTEVDKDLTRRSKASIDMLHNPFGGDEEEEPEEDLEVDLASWGLDSLIPDKKSGQSSRATKGKAKSDVLPNTRQVSTVGIGPRPGASQPAHSRSMSTPLAEFGEGGAFLDSRPEGRRNTISSPFGPGDGIDLERPRERQRTSSHPLIENLPIRPPLHSLTSYDKKRDTIPFPSSVPMPEESGANTSVASRPVSRIDALSEGLGPGRSDEPNPFSVPPPPPSRASRFDPKTVAHARTLSNATRLSAGPQLAYNDDDENHLINRAASRASVLDIKSVRDRRLSAASFRTRDMLDDDFQSAYGGDDFPAHERRYSRLDLMRPKVLVMPSPLQGVSAVPPSTGKPTRDGFLDSTDGRPMPPGARTSRLSMLVSPTSVSVPIASNSFTPNPRLSLSTSQLLFRNNLAVDGQRDVTYNDIDGNLRRAQEEGEKVTVELTDVKEEEQPAVVPNTLPLAEETKPLRPPGKLFGRSLIDDLEARKAEMRGKRRVFTGDQRPSMMDRDGMKRSSTFIDPATLQLGTPGVNRAEQPLAGASLARRGSRNSQPLLAIDGAGQIAETGIRDPKLTQTRSVFGVDTIWGREMAKLKEIEAQEKAEAEERKKREDEEEGSKKKKKKTKGKGKGKNKDEFAPEQSKSAELSLSPTQRETNPSLSLPDIAVVTSRRRTAPVPTDGDSDYESSASEAAPGRAARSAPLDEVVDQWVSDDEKKPAQTSAVGSGYGLNHLTAGDDSDEDMPLSMALHRTSHKLSIPRIEPDDSDEDLPLSSLLDKPKITVPSIDFDNLASLHSDLSVGKTGADEDDDDVPLGIRASRLPTGVSLLSGFSGLSTGGDDNEDDRPLSMHPAQIRKSSQFQIFAQVQAQQQQQMFHAQMANSMAFAPPPSMMLMMPPSVPFGPQPPIQVQEPNKFNSVDRWRHGVAVEGSS